MKYEGYWKPIFSEFSPEERRKSITEYRKELEESTRWIDKIFQWNVFLNVMDFRPPDFVLIEYLHVLLNKHTVTEEDIANIIDKNGMLILLHVA